MLQITYLASRKTVTLKKPYKTFSDKLAPRLYSLILQSLDLSALPTSMLEVVIIVIPKFNKNADLCLKTDITLECGHQNSGKNVVETLKCGYISLDTSRSVKVYAGQGDRHQYP